MMLMKAFEVAFFYQTMLLRLYKNLMGYLQVQNEAQPLVLEPGMKLRSLKTVHKILLHLIQALREVHKTK